MTYALFADGYAAYRAVEALRSIGISDAEFTLLSRKEVETAGDGAVRTDGPAPTTRSEHEPQGKMKDGGTGAYKAAAGLGVGAVVVGAIAPPIGIILGGGALASALSGTLMKKAAQGHEPGPIETALRERRVSEEAIGTIRSELDADGALLQLDHRSPDAQPSEANILQTISDHGGRIVWSPDELASPAAAANP